MSVQIVQEPIKISNEYECYRIRLFQDDKPASSCCITFRENAILGPYIHVSSMMTELEFRHCGFATMIIQHVIDIAKNRKVDIRLTSVRSIMKLYQKLGFVPVCKHRLHSNELIYRVNNISLSGSVYSGIEQNSERPLSVQA